MVRRSPIVLFALLLAGCPDDIGGGVGGGVFGLVAPSELEGVPNGGSEVVLTWKDHATVETGYRVEMNPVPFGTPVIGGVEYLPANATFMAYPVFPNSTYYFRVFAVTAAMQSDPSEVVVVTTPNVPHRPTNVVATTSAATRIALRWSDVWDETEYRIEKSSDHGASWSVGRTMGPNSTQTAFAGLAPDSEYLFRVIAVGPQGDSTPSIPARASTLTDVGRASFSVGTDTGKFISLVVTAPGEEHLAHYDATNRRAWYSKSLPVGYAGQALEFNPDLTTDIGGDGTSIAMDLTGTLHIAAHDLTNDRLLHYSSDSGGWKKTIVGPLAAGAAPRILCDPASGRLHLYAHAKLSLNSPVILEAWKAPGQPWVVTSPLPAEVDPASRFSVAIDSTGARLVAAVTLQQQLRVFRGTGIPGQGTATWTIEQVPLPGAPPDYMATASGPGGATHLVFHDPGSGGLYHATKLGNIWSTEPVDVVPGVDLGSFCSIAIHPASGRLHVAYYDATNGDLKYARKDPGGIWVRKLLDLEGDVGSHAAIGVDGAGVVRIAYRDATYSRMKTAKGTP